MAKAGKFLREELHATFRELAEVRAAYAELARTHHRAMRDHAVEEASMSDDESPGGCRAPADRRSAKCLVLRPSEKLVTLCDRTLVI